MAGSTFDDLGLRPELLIALNELGYEEPTPIQAEAIPPLVSGSDLLGQAATGTGKTAAFALPILHRLLEAPRNHKPMALVLVPTRELAVQVSEALHRYGRPIGAKVLPVYGGQPIGRQLSALQRGVEVLVATPGRALDLIARKALPLNDIKIVVLDEADEMLDMGFAEDIDAILEHLPKERQTVLFSATMPSRIDKLANRHLNKPVRIRIGNETAPGTVPLVRQTAYLVERSHKAAALGRLLDAEAPAAALVFCRTREEVDRLTETLNGRGYRAEPLHGGMSQEQRDRVMGRLRSGSADLLIATDVAARGLDVEQLTHVVNYDVPAAPESYVHRIGRVGRAGREGVALTLVEPREHRMLKTIEQRTKSSITIAPLPSITDLRARRLERTRAAVYEGLMADDLDRYRVVVESLTSDFDLMEIALAGVRLAHLAGNPGEEFTDIPEPRLSAPHADRRPSSSGRPASGRSGGSKSGASGRKERLGRGAPEAKRKPGPVVSLFINVGADDGVRPQDILGAITGESKVTGKDVGAIRIAERHTLVDVPEDTADIVVKALKGTRIQGNRVKVRRDRNHSA
jgi:ATP-dependent RNA helicase DeaD